MKFYKNVPILGLLFILITFYSCQENEDAMVETPHYPIVHQLTEPQSLNPANSKGSESTVIYYNMFQELINADFKTMEIIPVLAKARPTFTSISGSNLVEMAFEIRAAAAWDNGTPITGEDIAFSLKVIKVPQTDNGFKKPYFDYIKDIVIDEDNPKKFKFICEPYMLAEQVMSDLHTMPQYIYDPENILADYSIKALSNPALKAKHEADPKLKKFAEAFNSPNFQREVIVGSGPYELASWETGQRVVLSKKKNWWGEKETANHWLTTNQDTIVYEVIADPIIAFAALKQGRVNTLAAIDARLFKNEAQTPQFQEAFHTGQPSSYSYDYIGFNLDDPKFKNINTRKAIAHLVNKQELIDVILEGYGKQITSFIHPSKKKFLNSDVKPFTFNTELASKYLKEAGWEDSDNDGILDMMYEGQKITLTIKMITNNENTRRKAICESFKEAAEQVGIEVNIETPIWGNFPPMIMGKKFDLFVLGLISSPFESDPKQSWHSSSIKKGSNYVGYNNPEVDKIIDEMRMEVIEEKRLPHYQRIHKLIHDDIPVIFIMTQDERIAVNRVFDNVYFNGMKPGFWAPGFTISEQMTSH